MAKSAANKTSHTRAVEVLSIGESSLPWQTVAYRQRWRTTGTTGTSRWERKKRTGKHKAGVFLPFAGITRIRSEGLPHNVRSLSHRNGAPRNGNRVGSLFVLVNC